MLFDVFGRIRILSDHIGINIVNIRFRIYIRIVSKIEAIYRILSHKIQTFQDAFGQSSTQSHYFLFTILSS